MKQRDLASYAALDSSEGDVDEILLKAGALQDAIFNSANFSIIATDEKGVIQLFNVGAERLLGYSAAEVLNKITPADISDPEEVIARAEALSLELNMPITPGFDALVFKASRGIEDIYELTYIRKDESRFPAVVSVTPLRDDQNAIIGYLLIGTDNTARKQAEAERKQSDRRLRESQASLAGIVDSAIDAIITVDGDQRILHFNRAAEKMFLCSLSDAAGQSLERFLPERFRSIHSSHIDAFGRTGVASRAMGSARAVYGLRANGEEFPIEASISQLESAEGQKLFTVILRDVTERRQAEDQLRRLREEMDERAAKHITELQAANKELEAFSYSVAHDLRAPLRGIDGFSQALLEDCGDQLDDVGIGYLHEVRGASQEMAQLIDDVLQLARVARTEMHREPVNLTELAESIVKGLQQRAPERKVRVQIERRMETTGDKRLLKILLTNLLGNAWKFTSKREDAEIAFGKERKDGQMTHFVWDNGAGFDMAYGDKLFRAFQRLHTISEFEGTGIGLVTVQRIVLRHGGTVSAVGAVNEGATIFFTLPELNEE